MSAPEPREFDVCGPLPSGITVLEASAGTGKTHTIATLAARYVADGTPLDKILLVSFTRLAAGELRERVRARMIQVERGLAATLTAGASAADPVVAMLAAGDGPRARSRLSHAIASFDSATIATTHSFCHEVLGGLGIAGDLEPEATFVEDLSALRDEVLDDLYVRKYRAAAASIPFDDAAKIVRKTIDTPTATVSDPSEDRYDERISLARAARAELELRKRRLGVMSYDDLVGRLRDALTGPSAEAARVLLRARFDVALVDEFQDTDPVQWEILREGFGQPGQTLVLIADPKQAIYAFRGADVYAYLDATGAASDQATLPINWRSDQALIDGHDALFEGAQLGHPGIVYRPVRAAPDHGGTRLAGAPRAAPLRMRVLRRSDSGVELTAKGFAAKPSARELIAADVAADIATLLGSDATAAGRPIHPGDIAVLVRNHVQAGIVRESLEAAGVPAVINGAGSVFGTDAARHWLRLVEALERPASLARAHSAALTDFVGWSAEKLASADLAPSPGGESEWEDLHRRLHEWARILRGRGVASLLQEVTTSERLPARLLRDEDGERRLTDLRHIGQMLHAAATSAGLGPTALAGWLRARINEEAGDEERTRRLESDDDAVQILTIHRSKGLEFPITYVPFLWDGRPDELSGPITYHDARGRFMLDVSPGGPGRRDHARQSVAEDRGEDLRLAYVALTRARHQAIVWWAGSWDSQNTSLTRLLFARDEAGAVKPSVGYVPDDEAMLARLAMIAQASKGAIAVEQATIVAGAHWTPPMTAPDTLDASTFDRSLDLRWRRTSYTDITAASYDASVGSEPEQPLIEDEPSAEEPAPASAVAAVTEIAVPALLGEMPVGADVGTFVHSVMEATDFAAADLRAELVRRIAEVRARRAVDIGDPELVADGLEAMICTPLGDLVGGIALRDVTRTDRLDELGFELPLAGGDRPQGWVTVDRIAAVLRDTLPARDPLHGYAARLQDPFLRRSFRGYLTGSLDLVLRLPGPRFAVLDYKTNWLGEPGDELTAFHYRPQALHIEMYRHHYALQALLYTVALHRFLRWRLPGYDPATHLAGVAYLFVRGMTGGGFGVAVGSAPGVFSWRAPAGLATALSDALDEGEDT
ncbi:MAG TPA: UvrD-helicase domain-containing protein [Solirubrobacteraceae bacterium]|nr:UvrD-helicase domain-containing protein [Solirubrobacteraceae bacterium]